jgi:hypothetical protein
MKQPVQAEALAELASRQDWAGARDMPISGPVDAKNIAWLGLSACPDCNTGQVFVYSKIRGRSQTHFTADVGEKTIAALRAADEPAGQPLSPLQNAI